MPAPEPSLCQPGTSVLKAWGLKSAQVVDNYPTCCCLHVDEALFKSSLSPKSFVIFLDPRMYGHRTPTPGSLGVGCVCVVAGGEVGGGCSQRGCFL